MISLLTPPTLYYLIALIVVLLLIAYWKRKDIKKELRRWRFKEVVVGPVTIGRQEEENQEIKSKPVAGVYFGEGTNFTGTKIKRVAGRDVLIGSDSSRRNVPASDATPGIIFGDKGTFKDVDIEDVAGRDVKLDISKQPGLHTPNPSNRDEGKKTNDSN